MSQITINTSSGATPPYDIYICNVFGNDCVLVASIPSNAPPTVTLTLPTKFNQVPAIGLKFVDSNNCERLETVNCT